MHCIPSGGACCLSCPLAPARNASITEFWLSVARTDVPLLSASREQIYIGLPSGNPAFKEQVTALLQQLQICLLENAVCAMLGTASSL